MKTVQIERAYHAAPHALFGACLAALGQLGARIERHDAEAGTIMAALAGSGPFARASELRLQIGASGPDQARLVVSLPAPRRGDQRALATLMELVERFVPPA